MTKNEELTKLFKKWKRAIEKNEGKDVVFISDGIIDEKQFNKTKPKILFLGKEANDEKSKEDWDFREEWANDKCRWRHARQVRRWAYGILNDFPPFEEVEDIPPQNALLQIACMNLKKTGGGSSSKYDEIEEHTTKYIKYIREQVSIINPDIIIGGIKGYGLWDDLLGHDLEITYVEGIATFPWGKATAINFYHPSNRYPHSMQYALLSRIFKSPEFSHRKKPKR